MFISILCIYIYVFVVIVAFVLMFYYYIYVFFCFFFVTYIQRYNEYKEKQPKDDYVQFYDTDFPEDRIETLL